MYSYGYEQSTRLKTHSGEFYFGYELQKGSVKGVPLGNGHLKEVPSEILTVFFCASKGDCV